MSDVAFLKTLHKPWTSISYPNPAFPANVIYLPSPGLGDEYPANGVAATARSGLIKPALQSLIDAMPAQMAILDVDTRIIAVNAAWRQFGIVNGDPDGTSAIGATYADICRRPEKGCRDARVVQRGLCKLLSGTRSRISHTYSMTIGGRKRHFIMQASRFRSKGDLIVVSHTDITDAHLRSAERRHYCAALLRAEETERRRIARELHDDTSQQLALMQLGLLALGKAEGDGDIEQACRTMQLALNAVQRQLRTLSYVLHPPELDRAGIGAALETFAKGFGRRTGLQVEFVDETLRGAPGKETELAFYRIAQEALANVNKHASASRVVMRLRAEPSALILEIEDDGVGVPESICTGRAPEALGVGLVAMRERIEALAGQLEISRLAIGTRVTARVPRRRIGER